MAIKKLPPCFQCKNLNRGRYNKNGSFLPLLKCKAFPKGIPYEIAYGKNRHLKPLKNQDNDIVFEKQD